MPNRRVGLPHDSGPSGVRRGIIQESALCMRERGGVTLGIGEASNGGIWIWSVCGE